MLVANLNRDGLTHSEVETLLHEFGHVLHGVLSDTEYNQHAGTSVERDFVEAPSQMYEEWAGRMESLSLIRNHCATCPAIDEELVRRLVAAKKFGAGIDYGRQHLYASFDMALAGDPGESLRRGRRASERGGEQRPPVPVHGLHRRVMSPPVSASSSAVTASIASASSARACGGCGGPSSSASRRRCRSK